MSSERQIPDHMLFGSLLSSVRDGVWAASADGSTVVYVNPAVEQIYGHSAREFYANSRLWYEVIHPDDKSRTRESVRNLTDRGASQVEYRILRPDGTERWVLDRRNLILNSTGQVLGVCGTATDITERKAAEESLRDMRERFDLAIRGSNDGHWDWDLGTNTEWWSPLVYSLLGYEEGEIEATDEVLQGLIHPEDRERKLESMRAHLEERKPYDAEYRLRTKSGCYHWFRARGQALWDEKGRPVRMAGSIQDITDRKIAGQALEESRSRLQIALDALNGGVWDWNIQTGETYFTPSWCRMLGYEPHEVEGHLSTWEGALHPEDLPAVKRRLNEHFAGRAPYQSEHRMRTKNGEWIWVLDRGQVVERDRHGNPARMTGTDVDITEIKRLEDERRRLEKQVLHAQKLESLGLLAGGVAHDFNNILTGILGNAEVATQQDLPARAQDCLRKVQDLSLRAAGLCQQLLAYSGKGRFVVKAFSLSDLVRDMAQLLEISISKKVSLEFDLVDELPAIEADLNQVNQVVMNLITNASEAIGEANGTIVIRTRMVQPSTDPSTTRIGECFANGRYVCCEVIDSGCGLDEETMSKIFDPFFSTKFTGRGLGLAAVLGILRAHKGAVELSSQPGLGTTFRVMFPPCPQPKVSIAKIERAVDAWRGQGTVLVVDDEASVRGVARSILESRGFSVLVASDGREALELIWQRSHDIDAVLLDLTMPNMGGQECLREIRRWNPKIKVLLSSGFHEHDVVQRFGASGVAGFLQKPYRQAEFVAKLQDVFDA